MAFAMGLKNFIKSRFEQFLKRRVPGRYEHLLSRQNIFIMPTKFGFAYMFFVFLLFLLATNYQNNIIMLLSYLLASFFISVMMHSFNNFNGLKLQSSASYSGFAKQDINIPITINSLKKRYHLTLAFANQNDQHLAHLSHCETGNSEITLPFYANRRGIINLGRIKVSSEYGFGLFVAWSVLDFSHQIVVFPNPKEIETNEYNFSLEDESKASANAVSASVGMDDFSELKEYVTGESRARVAWKHFARDQGKYTKHYQSQQGGSSWLNLEDMPSHDIETQLSFLSYLINEYSNSKQVFGLKLGGLNNIKIEPSSGQKHQEKCLYALAHYPSQVSNI